MACSTCEIVYYTRAVKGICPLCEQMQVTQQLREALFQVTNANHMLQNRVESLVVQVDQLEAMKMTFDVMGVEDFAFIKSVVYRWQANRNGVAIKAIHGAPVGKSKRAPVTGFVVMFRDAETEVHNCNSVGGMALAAYLEEAHGLYGQIKAMEALARATLQHLEARVDS